LNVGGASWSGLLARRDKYFITKLFGRLDFGQVSLFIWTMPPFGFDDTFTVDPWSIPIQVKELPKPDFADNEELKQAFGIALGKGLAPFDAGLEVFAGDTPKGLWASVNWIKDPFAIAARDAYVAAIKKQQKPLDKDELLQEVLDAAKKAPEYKDKASLFKLYSDIAGYTGKAEPINSTVNNSQTNNFMKITLVKPETDFREPMKNSPNLNLQSKIQNEGTALPKLKLVGGSG
jgi:hypothetical protein